MLQNTDDKFAVYKDHHLFIKKLYITSQIISIQKNKRSLNYDNSWQINAIEYNWESYRSLSMNSFVYIIY